MWLRVRVGKKVGRGSDVEELTSSKRISRGNSPERMRFGATRTSRKLLNECKPKIKISTAVLYHAVPSTMKNKCLEIR